MRTYKDNAKEYALTQLGLIANDELVIIPRGQKGEYTTEQLDFIDTTVEWFFSGEWYEDELIEDEEEPDYYDVKSDMMYEDYISDKLINELEED